MKKHKLQDILDNNDNTKVVIVLDNLSGVMLNVPHHTVAKKLDDGTYEINLYGSKIFIHPSQAEYIESENTIVLTMSKVTNIVIE